MRLVFSLLLAISLSGCFTAGKRGAEQVLAMYDLGPPANAERQQRKTPLAIEVRAPLWFDSMGIEYRLAYADVARLREYANARWVGPPAQLIQQKLVQQLGFVPHGQSRARCVLRVDITEFSQIFETPEASHSLVQARMQWLDHSRARIAERDINLRSVAPSPDARGGVTALSASITALTVTVRQWESELTASGQLKACDA
ncbi:MAG: ABC-type transport auxiliary lipoprotein family protein [Rhodocyclaceae bacterium]|nr:ABC-type transport auxiliary lipoprotein family protein [Rhodocyclaceae bacterium]